MNKKIQALTLLVALLALVVAGASLALTLAGRGETGPARDVQYVMYVGTNDKDTAQPVCSPEEAQARAEAILISHFGGYTIQEARGGWIEGQTTYQEYTLVIYLSDTTEDKVHAAADELIAAFNQSSVLIQANETATEFYAGA